MIGFSSPSFKDHVMKVALIHDPLTAYGGAEKVLDLEELGHIALQANCGKEALDLLRGENAVDLVITDQAMPMGVQLAEAIAHEWPNMPIILATGYAELPPGAGRNMPTLSKPFCLKRLAEALAEVDAKGQGVARVVSE